MYHMQLSHITLVELSRIILVDNFERRDDH